ncbi:uncharacterized protein [Macrobrachium rosenbergii]|uniref:uncharacterized protein isoform X8 n=1 Tax=Macrobrachium rosenbergii TaxID=79674 RepID=UPI0034D68059
MEWSKEETIRFIEAYQKRELIWDPRHVAHYNKHRKQDAWEEVAKEMGTSVDVCKKKMEYLLAALRREKMKIKKSTGTGKGVHEVYTSSWFAFDSLKFLWDKNKPKPASSTNFPGKEVSLLRLREGNHMRKITLTLHLIWKVMVPSILWTLRNLQTLEKIHPQWIRSP